MVLNVDLRIREIQLISDILSMDDICSGFSCAVEVVQGAAVNQICSCVWTVSIYWKSNGWLRSVTPPSNLLSIVL